MEIASKYGLESCRRHALTTWPRSARTEGRARSAMLCSPGRFVQIKLRAHLLRALLCSVLVKAPVFPNPPATRTLPFDSKVAV